MEIGVDGMRKTHCIESSKEDGDLIPSSAMLVFERPNAGVPHHE